MFGITSLKEQVLELTNWIIVLRREVNELRCQVNVCKYTPERCPEETEMKSYVTEEYFDYKMGDIVGRLDQRNGDQAKWANHSYEKMNQVLDKMLDMEAQMKRLSKLRAARKKPVIKKEALPKSSKKKFTPAEV